MKKPLDHLLLLLASSSLRRTELEDAIYDLQQISGSELERRIEKLRTTARELSEGVSSDYSPREPEVTSSQQDAVDRAEKLLRHDANLSVREAADQLISLIKMKGTPSTSSLKLPNHESFHKWLLKLVSDYISPRELLHYATQIRNQSVHQPNNDWKLRDVTK